MSMRPCPNCNTANPAQYRFCGQCGTPLDAGPARAVGPTPPPDSPAVPGPPPAAPAEDAAPRPTLRLVVLRGPVAEGTVYPLRAGRVQIGTEGQIAFAGATGVDPVHVVLDVRGRKIDIVAVPGRGGCFRRIRGPVPIASGDIVFAGEQYLLVRRGADVPRASPQGDDAPVETFGTPLRTPTLHVTQLLGEGLPGRVASTDRGAITVGRENCDVSFPQDRFMSGRHLRIEQSAAELNAVDLGSLNGTFVRLDDLPAQLDIGDELMIGAVLLRLDSVDA
jgi:hypothetical protein